jgi:hypothetical protein
MITYRFKDSHRYCWELTVFQEESRHGLWYVNVRVDGEDVAWFDISLEFEGTPSLDVALEAITTRIEGVANGFRKWSKVSE